MVLIFWQGIISIHQKTFLEALAKQPAVSSVIMVAEQQITPYRTNMGWEVPAFGDVRLIVAPSGAEVDDLFRQYPGATHIFGGLRHTGTLAYALRLAIKQKARTGLMSEPYDRHGIRGQLRKLKYFYYKLRYFRQIHFILAIGREGVSVFRETGFSERNIFPWAYFVTVPITKRKEEEDRETGTRKIIYAGRIEEGKGILKFVKELASAVNRNYNLDIYGQGTQEEELKQFAAQNGLSGQVHVHPFIKYDALVKEYVHYDWVVLPSAAKDGWGVIVSEGLLNGLKVICSTRCGASWTVKNNFNGVVFDWNDADSCRKAIETMLSSDGFTSRENIQSWAARSISAEAGADYFLRILANVYEKGSRPAIPWEN